MIYYCASFSLFPSHHPLLPPRALREDDWGRVRSCFLSRPAGRVDFALLEKDCKAEPHFLQSLLKKAKEFFEATCTVKVIFYAANMK